MTQLTCHLPGLTYQIFNLYGHYTDLMPSDDLLTSPASIVEAIVESCAAPTSLMLACGCGTSQGSVVTPSVSHTTSALRS